MKHLLNRAYRLIVIPQREWAAIAAAGARPRAVFARYVVPLAVIPAAAWMLGLFLFAGDVAAWNGSTLHYTTAAILRNGAVGFIGSIASVVLLAAMFYLMAPMYSVRRNWAQAWTIAAHGTTPIWLAGLLFLKPTFVPVMVLALLQCVYLYYVGLQAVAGVKRSDAAEYVAIAMLLMLSASTILGGLLGAIENI